MYNTGNGLARRANVKYRIMSIFTWQAYSFLLWDIVITSNKLPHKYIDFTSNDQDSCVANMYTYKVRANLLAAV